jgi:hypothetical protein
MEEARARARREAGLGSLARGATAGEAVGGGGVCISSSDASWTSALEEAAAAADGCAPKVPLPLALALSLSPPGACVFACASFCAGAGDAATARRGVGAGEALGVLLAPRAPRGAGLADGPRVRLAGA